MNKRALWICLVSAVVAATSGCCELGSFLCCPLGSLGSCVPVCEPTHCCDGAYCGQCGPACGVCGPACEPCGDVCVDACCEPSCCDTCCDPCCGSCCDPCGGSCWSGCGPLSWLLGGLGWGCCGSGCGECYWSDFHSEPPDNCDPCDRYGNWTGGSCGGGCGAGCRGCGADCGGGYSAVKPVQSGYAANNAAPRRQAANRAAPSRQVANRAAPSKKRAIPAWALRDLEGPVITDPSSPYAPKLVSVTDHAASPTLAEPAPVEQTASAERPVVRQASVKQVVKPRPTPARR